MRLRLLLQRFREFPHCLDALSLSQIEGFISLARHLRYRISLRPCTSAIPPTALPRSVHAFICAAANIEHEDAKICWEVLRDYIWSLSEQEVDPAVYLDLFLQHGTVHGIGFRDLYPPTRTCLNPMCQILDPETGDVRGRGLTNKEYTYQAVLFSHDIGPIPLWSTSWECVGCGTRYYHNYYVQKKNAHEKRTRTYYGGCPTIIEVTEKVFVTDRLCEWVCNQMVCAWVSGTNIARIYNLSHVSPACQWPVKFELEAAHVWDAFYTYSLLLQHSEDGRTLSLPDQAPNSSERLKSALEARNAQMVGPGQELWSHACDLCCKNVPQPDGPPSTLSPL
ncbi:hypothetical protein AURDEDRAFT_64768 [Auricularia subglabra TFB-10046 SS5]|nr:hypothetical protein AURDEDRAFT_64768 [Auricularia subglabra TFB-10046 SS5]